VASEEDIRAKNQLNEHNQRFSKCENKSAIIMRKGDPSPWTWGVEKVGKVNVKEQFLTLSTGEIIPFDDMVSIGPLGPSQLNAIANEIEQMREDRLEREANAPEGLLKAEDMEVEDWMRMLGCDIVEAEALTASYREKDYNPCDTFMLLADGTMEPTWKPGDKR
jgi:hypothetical protein